MAARGRRGGALIVLLLAAAVLGALLFKLRSGSARAHRLVSGGATLLDVRTPAEFGAGHLEGARNIPVQDLARRLDEVGPREKPVVVYCHSGARAALAARTLRAAGFREVVNLGPMAAWSLAAAPDR